MEKLITPTELRAQLTGNILSEKKCAKLMFIKFMLGVTIGAFGGHTLTMWWIFQ